MADEPIGPTRRCGQCNKEIPHPEAMTAEGQDYAVFFCGFECYQQWRRRDERAGDASRDRD